MNFAIAAAAAKDEPAEYRNIVVKLDVLLALGAGRARIDYRKIPWHAVDTHVQKATEGQPQGENSECDYRIQKYHQTADLVGFLQELYGGIGFQS